MRSECSRASSTICCITSLPGLSCGCALPATTSCTGSASSRSRSVKTRRRACRWRSAARSRSSAVRDRGASARRAALRGGVHAPERLRVEVACASSQPASSGGGRRVDAGVARAASASAGSSQVPRWTPFVTCPISVSTSCERRPHLARDLAVQRGDAVRVGGQAQRHAASARTRRLVAELAEREQVLVVDARLVRRAADVAGDELGVEDLVAGGHGRVGGEDGGALDVRDRVVGRQAALRRARGCARSRGTPSGPRSCGRRSRRRRARRARARRRRRAAAPGGCGARGRRSRARR